MAKRKYGGGAIEPRGPGKFRLRYNIDGERFSQTVTGTKAEAQVKLRALMTAGDNGAHVEPNKITVGEWIDEWLASGAPRPAPGSGLTKYSGKICVTAQRPHQADPRPPAAAAIEVNRDR